MQKGRSPWLALIAFCATTAVVTALVLALVFVFASATVAFASGQSFTPSMRTRVSGEEAAADQKFSGMITDAECGARHARDSGKNPAECTRACVRNGSRYVLVDGDRIYTLAGSTADVEKLAGQRVSVRGTLAGDTIHVGSVTAR